MTKSSSRITRLTESLVALPSFKEVGLLFYRDDLLDKYQRDVPKTWKELAQTATHIQEEERAKDMEFTGFVWQADAYEGLTCNALEWIASRGGLDPNTKAINFDSPAVLDALDQARQWLKGEKPISEMVGNFTEEKGLRHFLDGHAAFLRIWTSAYAKMVPKGHEASVRVAPLPHGSGSGDKSVGVLGGWHLAIPKTSRNKEAAISFLRYMTSANVQSWLAIEGGLPPPVPVKAMNQDVLKTFPLLKDRSITDIEIVRRISTRENDTYSGASECFYKAVKQALGRESRDEIIDLSVNHDTARATPGPSMPR